MSVVPDWKPTRQQAERDREAEVDFRVAVLATDRGCIVHDDPSECEGRLEVHHVITQQQLRRARRFDLLWDPDNGATVCETAHRRHTRGLQRIPFSRLPQRCIDFARDNGFLVILDRYYPR